MLGHFIERHFKEGPFMTWHYKDRHFNDITFSRKDISMIKISMIELLIDRVFIEDILLIRHFNDKLNFLDNEDFSKKRIIISFFQNDHDIRLFYEMRKLIFLSMNCPLIHEMSYLYYILSIFLDLFLSHL